MSDAAQAFEDLTKVVIDLRKDVAEALDRAAPDYRRDLAQLFTALKVIEQKPALGASGSALDAAARAGAREGAAEAVAALRAAQRALEGIQGERIGFAREIERQSRYLWGGAFAAVLVVGLICGTVLGVRTFPASLMATKAGCSLGGGLFVPAKGQNPDACVYWGKPG